MHERQIFWSGGIGDIFALESTFTDEQRTSIRRMFWATRAKEDLSPLFTRMPGYTNLVEHISLWNQYPPGFCIINLPMATSMTDVKITGHVEDWSVVVRFPSIQTYTYSSFLRYRVANITRFQLPDDFVTICPYSICNFPEIQSWRRFHQKDWDWLLSHLDDNALMGVVLNLGSDHVPVHPRVIDLSNRTKLGEAIEILKKSSGYYGIDSCFSVLASKLFSPDKFRIATMNAILWQCKHIYYTPQSQFDFIVPWLGATEKERIEWIQKLENTPR